MAAGVGKLTSRPCPLVSQNQESEIVSTASLLRELPLRTKDPVKRFGRRGR